MVEKEGAEGVDLEGGVEVGFGDFLNGDPVAADACPVPVDEHPSSLSVDSMELYVPALAITTSNLPTTFFTSSTALKLLFLLSAINSTTCSFSGYFSCNACRSVAPDGLRAPAKMVGEGSLTRMWMTRARPMPRLAPETVSRG